MGYRTISAWTLGNPTPKEPTPMLRSLLRTSPIATCSPETPIQTLAKKMTDEDVGAVVVCDDRKRPLGVVTDRDIVLRCVAGARDCSSTRTSEVMTGSAATARDTDGIYDVVRLMRRFRVRRIPIVTENGEICGLISHGDVLALLGRELHDLSLASTHFEKIETEADKNMQKAA